MLVHLFFGSEFRVWGRRFGVWGLGFRVQGLGRECVRYGVQGLELKVEGAGCTTCPPSVSIESRDSSKVDALTSPEVDALTLGESARGQRGNTPAAFNALCTEQSLGVRDWGLECGHRITARANSAQLRQSRPDSGLGLSHFQAEAFDHASRNHTLAGPLWEGCRESRRCSMDIYPESYTTKYTSIRR